MEIGSEPTTAMACTRASGVSPWRRTADSEAINRRSRAVGDLAGDGGREQSVLGERLERRHFFQRGVGTRALVGGQPERGG